MELPHIGEVCTICQRNDYLPFKCDHCDKTVCIDHRANHGSDCPLSVTKFVRESHSHQTETLKRSCDFCHKITLKLELTECIHCKCLLCLYHRHQVQHKCKKLAEDKESMRLSAEEKLKRQRLALDNLKVAIKSNTNTHKRTNDTPIAQPIDPRKQELAKKVRIMQIKQGARGPPNILEDDKIYFRVKFKHVPSCTLSEASNDGNVAKIYTSLKHSVGRMIDWSAEQLSVKNKNDVQDARQLVFQKQITPDELLTLDSQVSFLNYFNEKTIDSGDELILTYI